MARISIIGGLTAAPTIDAKKLTFAVAEKVYKNQQNVTNYYEVTVVGDFKMKRLSKVLDKGSQVVIQNAEFDINVSQQGKVYRNVFIGDGATIDVTGGYKKKQPASAPAQQQGGFEAPTNPVGGQQDGIPSHLENIPHPEYDPNDPNHQ